MVVCQTATQFGYPGWVIIIVAVATYLEISDFQTYLQCDISRKPHIRAVQSIKFMYGLQNVLVIDACVACTTCCERHR